MRLLRPVHWLLIAVFLSSLGIAAFDAFETMKQRERAATAVYFSIPARNQARYPRPALPPVIAAPYPGYPAVARTIAGVCERLGCEVPIAITVMSRMEMTLKAGAADAFVTRLPSGTVGKDGNPTGCLLYFNTKSVLNQSTVAHEVCHCVMDYEALTARAYRFGIEDEEVDRRERRAAACEAVMTRTVVGVADVVEASR